MKSTFDFKMSIIAKIDGIDILVISVTFRSDSDFRERRGIILGYFMLIIGFILSDFAAFFVGFFSTMDIFDRSVGCELRLRRDSLLHI